MGNSYISNVTISRKNQEFSRGDSWFNVQWLEIVDHHPVPRSVNLRFEPGRQVCTSYPDDVGQQPNQQPHQSNHNQHVAPRQGSGPPPMAVASTQMELDPPKPVDDWSGLVGDLFDKAAGIVDEKSQTSKENSPPKSPEPSTALWSQNAWKAIMDIIWGHQVEGKSDRLYTYGIPYVLYEGPTEFRHATFGVVVERCKNIVDVFWSSAETQPANCQHFIHHAPRKKISLKTLARVLGVTLH